MNERLLKHRTNSGDMQDLESTSPEHVHDLESRNRDVTPSRSEFDYLTWLPVAVFCLVTLPLIFGNYHASRAGSDQTYHLRAVEQFARDWPHFDFRDYPSTTTPGYHLLLAAAAHFGLSSVTSLRLIGWLLSLGMMIELARHAKPLGGKTAVWVCLPLVASLYVVSSAAWILPDNAAWWGVIALLSLAFRPRWSGRTIFLSGLLLFVLVWVRQVHLWMAAVLWAAAWMNEPKDAGSRKRVLGLTVLATLPAFVTVAAFARLWHGLLPPSIAEEIRHGWYAPQNVILTGPNPAAPAAILAVFGINGVFFIEFLWEKRDRLAILGRWIMLGAFVGILAGILPPTDYSFGNRSSGIWNITPYLPHPMHRSVVIIVLSGLGGAIFVAWAIAFESKARWIWIVAWFGFIASQVPNPSAFQRYFEPFCLLILVFAVVQVRKGESGMRPVWIGPLLLTILLGAITAWSIH